MFRNICLIVFIVGIHKDLCFCENPLGFVDVKSEPIVSPNIGVEGKQKNLGNDLSIFIEYIMPTNGRISPIIITTKKFPENELKDQFEKEYLFPNQYLVSGSGLKILILKVKKFLPTTDDRSEIELENRLPALVDRNKLPIFKITILQRGRETISELNLKHSEPVFEVLKNYSNRKYPGLYNNVLNIEPGNQASRRNK